MKSIAMKQSYLIKSKGCILHASNTKIEFNKYEMPCMILAEVISELNSVEFDVSEVHHIM